MSVSYTHLQNLFNGETIYTPVDTKVPMRPLITPQQANELIEAIPQLDVYKRQGQFQAPC